MSDVKNCFKWLAFYYLLLAGTIPMNVHLLPESMPIRQLLSVYLLILSVCLIIRYHLRVTGQRKLRFAMLSIASMILMDILLRAIKYTVFGSIATPGRYTWYLYYVPSLLIPLFSLLIALCVYAKEDVKVRRIWWPVAIITAALIVFVLTNDFHQQVFRFQPGFMNWDGDYSHSWGFFLVTAWEYLLYLIAFIILLAKCVITKIRLRAWMIPVPVAVGVLLMILIVIKVIPAINGYPILEYPEVFCFMVAGYLECCMQLGLIPTNEYYRGLMKITSVPVQIADFSGKVIYQSEKAYDLTSEEFLMSDNSRIGEHTILRRMDIKGGFGFWQTDVTELDKLNEELAEAKEQLSEENELISLQNAQKENQTKIEQRTRVYDEIEQRTKKQLTAISNLAKEAKSIDDASLRDKYRKHITLLGSYIKRYANLMLLSSDSKEINMGELGLSFSEVLRYLNAYGIPSELINDANGSVNADNALLVFESFEAILEDCLDGLMGVLVNISAQGDYVICKITLENAVIDSLETIVDRLRMADIKVQSELEDNDYYISLTIPRGGEGA